MSRFLTCIAALGALIPHMAYASTGNCREEVQRGVASWYGPGFEGAKTMSEESFNPMMMSAAHPTLPFGTVLKVVNMRNHRSVTVKVNDRGAFGKKRVIDLSEGAAHEIGMIDSGTAPVAIFKCHP
ncbi:MAG: hypothetical protein DI551_07035 [Micavibrio aeruginosavorus]|uniref:Probable endolytic peptidoglycan transglycosylase RlpA n=1 Tax=Micavibrio aeruginosavorus TaxID=349221 RepID=A0A2W5MYX1_9BACT|nr:MAG: hypothetical protein DI551_07035 [Micavibrio aeruginosavorus]